MIANKKKIGRNNKCPCGSGKLSFLRQKRGVIVKKLKNGVQWVIGDTGITIAGLVEHHGNCKNIIKKINDYIFILDVDIPFLLPLNNDKYVINIENTEFVVFHKTKKRGEELFSTLDSNSLPNFSHLQIQGTAFPDDLQGKPFKIKEEDVDIYHKSYIFILKILKKIISYLNEFHEYNLQINAPLLSYEIYYIKKSLPIKKENILVQSIYPYSGNVKIESQEKRKSVDHKKLKAFLTESLKLQNYVEKTIIPNPIYKDASFSEMVFFSIHDFLYYCRQHPKVLNKLDEEQIRDLYLIIIKNLFSCAEGEAYNYKGKLDYKILNLNNKYEFISGEFKWWKGGKSLEEAYDQIVRKHTSGQEKEVYIIILSKNKNINKVKDQISLLIKKEKETVEKSLKENIVPKGSNEYFIEFLVSLKVKNVPLKIGLADLYYK